MVDPGLNQVCVDATGNITAVLILHLHLISFFLWLVDPGPVDLHRDSVDATDSTTDTTPAPHLVFSCGGL